MTGVEIALTKLGGGGKFGGDGYKVSGGLHGVGVSVVNALSVKVEVEVDRDGKRHHIEFADGGTKQTKLQVVGDAPRGRTGTTVTFWPDPMVFEVTEFAARTLLERFQMMAFLNKGLEIRFRDEREGHDQQEVRYRYAGGIVDFVKHVNESKEPLFSKVGYFEQAEDDAGGRARVPVEHRLPDRRPALLRQRHRHHRGRHARGGLPRRAHHDGEPLRQGQGPPQGEGPEPRRRGHPRGPHRHHLGAPPRPAVRGPDQGQARQPARSRRWCRRPPTRSSATGCRSTPPRPTRSSRRASPRSGPGPRPARPATPPAASPRSTAPACPTS